MASAASQTIAWHRRLEARVTGSIILIVGLALGSALLATTRALTMRSLDRAASDLEAARTAFDYLVEQRAEFAASQAGLVTALPVFRAYMTSELADDVASLEQMGEDYRKEMQADFAIVTDQTGRWMAAPGWPARKPLDAAQGRPGPGAVGAIVTGATKGRPARIITEINGRLYLVVSEPARFAEEVLGTLTIGFVLDDRLATRLGAETHGDVNLVSGRALVASSLTGADRAALASRVVAGDYAMQSGASSALEAIGDDEFAIGVFPLTWAVGPPALSGSSAAPAQLVFLQNWAPTRTFIADTRRRLSLAALVIFLPTLYVGLVFSRRTTRPLHDLVLAAGDIAGGNWSRQIEPSGGAETQLMAHAFNEMATSLRHWYDEAKTRDDQFRQAQKMEAIGRLAGGIAHDFNNLLTAIKGYSELLKDELADNDPHKEEVIEIVKAADRAAELTRQLLAFSRRQVIATHTLSLAEIVLATEHMLRRLIGEDVELIKAVPEDLWPVTGDSGQLGQVVVNLAVNARDAMPKGGHLRIELLNVVFGDQSGVLHPRLASGRYVQLAVSDTGTGMDPETAGRIFEPFFTTKESGRGTGLGLAMVYGVVEQAGGAIDVETAVGHGTTFRLYFPSAAERESSVEHSATAQASSSPQGTETILLVEDDHHVSALISRALTRAGYHVLVARHGEHALEILRMCSDPIDLLLTDVIMPGMNGRELSERVLKSRPETRVLFMSGYSDDAILRHGVQTAAAHFIQKPFSMDALGIKIREALLAEGLA